jgi:hypothetical protein
MIIRVGRIYKVKYDGVLRRIIRSGGAGYYSGRGCVPAQATPDNHIRATDVTLPTPEEINTFLELEMASGMVQTINAPMIYSKGDWIPEVSSGYRGLRCRKCATWVYEGNERRCECDGELD